MRRKGLQRKHISDDEIIEAWLELQSLDPLFIFIDGKPYLFTSDIWIYDLLPQYPAKLVLSKMEQMVDRGIMDYGVSLRTAWVNTEYLVRHLTRTA